MGYQDARIITFDDAQKLHSITLPRAVSFVRVNFAPITFTIYAGYGTSIPIRTVNAGEQCDVELAEATDTLTFSWVIAPAVPGAVYAKAVLIVSEGAIATSGSTAGPIMLAQYDSLGQPRAFYPWGNANSLTNEMQSAGLVAIVNEPVAVEPYPLNTYDVVPRRTTRDYSTNVAFAGAGRSLLATLWNPAASVIAGRLVAADVAIIESTAAVECWIDLIRINTQPTGGSSYTPVPRYTSQAAATVEARRLPSAGGAETGDALQSAVYKLGITGAVSTVNPAPAVTWQPLFRASRDNERLPEFLAGSGIAIVGDVNAATTVRFVFRWTFMEV